MPPIAHCGTASSLRIESCSQNILGGRVKYGRGACGSCCHAPTLRIVTACCMSQCQHTGTCCQLCAVFALLKQVRNPAPYPAPYGVVGPPGPPGQSRTSASLSVASLCSAAVAVVDSGCASYTKCKPWLVHRNQHMHGVQQNDMQHEACVIAVQWQAALESESTLSSSTAVVQMQQQFYLCSYRCVMITLCSFVNLSPNVHAATLDVAPASTCLSSCRPHLYRCNGPPWRRTDHHATEGQALSQHNNVFSRPEVSQECCSQVIQLGFQLVTREPQMVPALTAKTVGDHSPMCSQALAEFSMYVCIRFECGTASTVQKYTWPASGRHCTCGQYCVSKATVYAK